MKNHKIFLTQNSVLRVAIMINLIFELRVSVRVDHARYAHDFSTRVWVTRFLRFHEKKFPSEMEIFKLIIKLVTFE